jgi:hypothetical protein
MHQFMFLSIGRKTEKFCFARYKKSDRCPYPTPKFPAPPPLERSISRNSRTRAIPFSTTSIKIAREFFLNQTAKHLAKPNQNQKSLSYSFPNM